MGARRSAAGQKFRRAGSRHLDLEKAAAPLAWLSTDGKKLLVTRVLRTFAYGYLAVVIALYLSELGLDTIQVGIVLSAAIFGSALMTVLWALVADRDGRRRTVATMAVFMIAGGFIAGGLKIAYDLLLFAAFRNLRPPEEAAVAAQLDGRGTPLP